MKHFLLFTTLMSGASYAQITIDQNDFPAGNDTALVSISDDTNLDLLSTGANHNWDFSTLHIQSQRIDTFYSMSTASALYQLQFNNVFTEPEYASDFYQNLVGFDLTGASDAGITVGKPVTFVKINSSAYQNVGIGMELNSIEVPMAMDTIDTEYQLPMNYNDTWTSNSYIYVDLNPAFNGIFQRYQYRTSVVDGWGTITTKFGTFDVLRVRTELAYDDSAYVDFGFGGTWLELPTPDEVVYTWWSEDNKVPILKVVAQVVGGNEVVTRVEFKDYERNILGIEDNNANTTLNIYPNPTNDIASIEVDQNLYNKIMIYDVAGKLILERLITNSQEKISVENWNAGIYTVNLVGENASINSKLIVQ